MISVVVCSVKQVLAQQVKSNIDNTIGVPWEAIIIDNKNSSRGITEVYNEGVKQARYPVICFVHEDVDFLTQQWGKLVMEYFEKDPSLGMIGVAGSRYKSKTLSGWMTSIDDFDRYNILHLDSAGKRERLYFDQQPALPLKEVIILDGVFLCTRKDIIAAIPFDQVHLNEFHLYDLDISFRISRSYKVAVSFGIDLVHFTEGGDFGNSWVENTLKWHKIYASQFPAGLDKECMIHREQNEYRVLLFWLKRLKIEKISFKNKLQWVIKSGALVQIRLWPHVIIFFLFKPLKYVLGKP